MISNYKRPGSIFWRCSYYITGAETGETKQVRQPTHKIVERKTKGETPDIERKARDKAGADCEKSRRILEALPTRVDRFESH